MYMRCDKLHYNILYIYIYIYIYMYIYMNRCTIVNLYVSHVSI